MRILIISHSYAPNATPRAFRWTSIAEYWAENGHTVDVICGQLPELPAYEIRQGVNVHRVGGSAFAALRRTLLGKANPNRNIAHADVPGTGNIVLQNVAVIILRWLHDQTWKNLYWPDYAAPWRFAAVGKVKQLLAKHDYDGLISVSLPFTDHLVGRVVHRKRPQLPWIVDIGDPFSFMTETPVNNQWLFRSLNRISEGRVLRDSTAISVTTSPTLQEYIKHFPDIARKVNVIPPLLPPAHISAQGTSLFPDDGKIRIAFFGTLYRNIRNPDTMLVLFRQLLRTRLGDRLELHFFGTLNDCGSCFESYQDLLNTKIFLHGLISRDVALLAMQKAQVLINIGNRTGYQLPSKVVEYASTGKPIINMAGGPADSSTVFFKDYPAAFCLNRVADEKDIDRLVNFIESAPNVDINRLDAWLREFRIDAVAGSYEKLLRRLPLQDQREYSDAVTFSGKP